METTSAPFDLNQAIQLWREVLNGSPAFSRENLEELESHLRDSIAQLKQHGLAADEAFFIASRRVGSGAALGTEFGKINADGIWLSRALWMLIGVQVFGCIGSLAHAVSLGTAVLGLRQFGFLSGGSSMPLITGLLYGLVHLLTFAFVLMAGWKLLTSKGNGVSAWLKARQNRSRRLTVMVAAFLILIVLPRVIPAGIGSVVFRFISPANTGHFLSGFNYGIMSASLLQSALLIVLTLMLARRQLFAKTGA